jgi:hypothetical protein
MEECRNGGTTPRNPRVQSKLDDPGNNIFISLVKNIIVLLQCGVKSNQIFENLIEDSKTRGVTFNLLASISKICFNILQGVKWQASSWNLSK